MLIITVLYQRLFAFMIRFPGRRLLAAHPLRAVLWLAILVVIVKAAIDGMTLGSAFSSLGNDDIMRLLSVRDWIAGQGWYDVAQYRLLPPEGVPLHWSRYLDLGIAAIILPFSLIFPMDVAELIGATLWPTLVMILTVLAIGFGTQRVFGRSAACFAVLCVALWPLTADLHARPGNVDHHNIQLLMMVIVAFAVIWPSRPATAGLVGGIAAAFSLAIGLESMPFIVGAGLALLVRAFYLGSAQSRSLLASFCVALAIGGILFFMGQTPPSAWTNQVCDQLGPQTLSLVAVAVVACLVPLAASRWLTTFWLQLGTVILLTAFGMALIWPVLADCFDGPYGDLPPAIQETISGRITEARPALSFARFQPVAALLFMLPVIVSFIAGGLLWIAALRPSEPLGHRQYAIGLLLILCVFGTLMVMVQMRSVIMVASVVPVIGGVVVAHLMHAYINSRDLVRGLAAIAVAVLITAPGLVIGPLAPLFEKEQGEETASRGDCLQHASLQALNAVPPAVILSHLNFGPGLIWATHHDGLSAPYHRSARAMENGILPFQMENEDMAAYVRSSGATHLLLCRGYDYDSDFADLLAEGATVDWLRLIALSDETQVLYEVLQE